MTTFTDTFRGANPLAGIARMVNDGLLLSEATVPLLAARASTHAAKTERRVSAEKKRMGAFLHRWTCFHFSRGAPYNRRMGAPAVTTHLSVSASKAPEIDTDLLIIPVFDGESVPIDI